MAVIITAHKAEDGVTDLPAGGSALIGWLDGGPAHLLLGRGPRLRVCGGAGWPPPSELRARCVTGLDVKGG